MEDRVDGARTAAVRLLAARSRSRAELDQALRRRGFPEEDVARALEDVARLGYLDDGKAALARATGLLRARRLAPQGVKARLLQQGFGEAIAAGAVDGATRELSYEPEVAARALLAQRRLDPADPKARRRAAQLLAGRGFDEGLIERLVGAPALDSVDEGS